MENQAFILSYILTEFQKKISEFNWLNLNVVFNKEEFTNEEINIDIKVTDINTNLYLNVNDKIKVDGKLIPRSLPVECSLTLFVTSENQINQLKAFGIILQAFRDERKIDVGDFDWLNNQDSPMTIDFVPEPDKSTKIRLQDIWNRPKALLLFFNINCCIDSNIADDFVEVKHRKVQMEKIDVK